MRLGAGPPDGELDMNALRAHKFFRDIDWNTVWTSAVPPLEAGIVKRDPASLPKTSDWGVDWDGSASPSLHDDDIEWVSESELSTTKAGTRTATRDVAIGPLGEIRTMSLQTRAPNGNPSTEDTTQLLETRSSSSEDSAMDGVTKELSNLDLFQRTTAIHPQEEPERGRATAMSPIQGHGPPPDL
jgi:3-phosphoinositide dependent protein kinase-1